MQTMEMQRQEVPKQKSESREILKERKKKTAAIFARMRFFLWHCR